MGGSSSSELPKPEPLLKYPWRVVKFSNDAYKKLQKEITNHQPHPKASTTNILISGNVGSGKSSFLNSVFSELRREELNGRVQNIQTVRPGAETSVTQHLRFHKFNDKIKIFDTAGFELEKTENATIILKKIIDGEVAEGSKFDGILETKIKMAGDKIHCVVLVISIHIAENLDPALIQCYEEFIGMLTKIEVPCQLLVTFVDKLVKKTDDLKDLYRRRDIKQKLQVLRTIPLQSAAEEPSIGETRRRVDCREEFAGYKGEAATSKPPLALRGAGGREAVASEPALTPEHALTTEHNTAQRTPHDPPRRRAQFRARRIVV
ncbi:UNVERIFIED_CONTAM: hypothetical protein FKN15_053378 [Acipenser sinensis]